MEREVSTTTRTEVSVSSGYTLINCQPNKLKDGSVMPQIRRSAVPTYPVRVDNTLGREGELLITNDDEADATLNSNGELIVTVTSPDDADRYSRIPAEDNKNLNWSYSEIDQNDEYNLTTIGDSITVRVDAQLSGTLRFTLWNDVVNGTSGTRTVKREFCISDDGGMFFSEWMELNNENLTARHPVVENNMIILIRYTRTGTDTEGVLKWSNLNIIGYVTNVQFDAPTYRASIFNGLIEKIGFVAYENNIFKKLYFRGIVPAYITRCENRDPDEDRDYIDLFKSVARYFTLFIMFFKRWENARNDYDILLEQVRQYGIYFNEETITLEELQYLAQNIMSQAQQRGTKMIFSRKGDTLPNGETAQIDGEFIRLLKNDVWDDLMYDEMPLWKTGWVMRQSSPMYKGTMRSSSLNKTPALPNGDFPGYSYSLPSEYVLTTEGVSFVVTTDDDKRVARFSGSNVVCAGFGRKNDSSSFNVNKLFNVDCNMDYEVYFAFKINGATNGCKLLFAVEGFDKNKRSIQDAFMSVDGSGINQQFFKQDCGMWKQGEWYFARGIIHAYGSRNVFNTHTNLGIGTDLVFNGSRVKYILPKIQIVESQGVSANISFWDYTIRPLVRGNNIIPLRNETVENAKSFGFIQANKFTFTYARNNNASLSYDELATIIERYLYPMDTTNLIHIYNK